MNQGGHISLESLEAIFIGVPTSRGYPIGHRVLISAAPNLGSKVICMYSGLTTKDLLKFYR